MKFLRVVALVVSVVSLVGCASPGPRLTNSTATHISPEIEPYLLRGIRSFKSRQYQDAIANYNKALVIEPNHSVALYELALTYMTMHRNDECIATAEGALRNPGESEFKLLTMLGSCHSQAGNFDSAMAAYERSLQINPDDSSVHFNMAVSYAKQNQDDRAVDHLEKSIEINPKYSSPYLVLGEMHRRNGRDVEAVFMFMQFTMLEGNTRRSAIAAKSVFAVPYVGVDFKNNSIMANLDTIGDDSEMGALTIGLRAIAMKSKSDSHSSAVSRHVAVISDLVELAGSFGDSDRQFRKRFLWKYAIKEAARLHASGDFEAFAYMLAAKAEIEGADQWLLKNTKQVQRLAGLAE